MDLDILDLDASQSMLVTLSEFHGRVCTKIASCGDMEESTQLSGKLVTIAMAYNEVERVAAKLRGRPASFLNITPERKA